MKTPTTDLSRRAVMALAASLPFMRMAKAANDNFPTHALRIVVPLGPGSAFDTASRFFADQLAKVLEQPVVVENRPGADTAIGVRNVLGAPADGYSILALTGSTISLTPYLMKEESYDPRQIRPLAGFLRGSVCFVVGASSRFKTLQQVVAALRNDPESVSLGHYGQLYRYGSRLFETMASVRFNQVIYNSPSQTTTDVIGGTIDLAILESTAVIPLVRSKSIRAIAIASEERNPALPDVPTTAECGWPGFTMRPWTAFAVSSKTPQTVFAKLEAASLKVANSPVTAKWIAERLLEPMALNSVQMNQLLERETAAFAPFVKEMHVQ